MTETFISTDMSGLQHVTFYTNGYLPLVFPLQILQQLHNHILINIQPFEKLYLYIFSMSNYGNYPLQLKVSSVVKLQVEACHWVSQKVQHSTSVFPYLL